MQRVSTVRFTSDANFVISGSDDTNIRIWKAQASKALGSQSGRKQRSDQTADAIKKRFAHMPEVKRITKVTTCCSCCCIEAIPIDPILIPMAIFSVFFITASRTSLFPSQLKKPVSSGIFKWSLNTESKKIGKSMHGVGRRMYRCFRKEKEQQAGNFNKNTHHWVYSRPDLHLLLHSCMLLKSLTWCIVWSA